MRFWIFLVLSITIISFTLSAKGNSMFVKEMTIDLDDVSGEIALIRGIDVDKQGNLYLLDVKLRKIFVLDKAGKFQLTFGRQGSGPGEFRVPMNLHVTADQDIVIADPINRKFSIYKKNGDLVKDIKINIQSSGGYLMNNGYYLLRQSKFPEAKGKSIMAILSIYSPQTVVVKELVALESINMFGEKIMGINYEMSYSYSGDKVAVGNPLEGYEILLFDQKGNALKPITREFKPVSVTEQYKRSYIENMGKSYQMIKNKLTFPEKLPAFHDMTMDENGRVYVFTYQHSAAPDGYMVEIFSFDGTFAGAAPFKFPPYSQHVKCIRNSRLYYVYEEPESGSQRVAIFEIKPAIPQ